MGESEIFSGSNMWLVAILMMVAIAGFLGRFAFYTWPAAISEQAQVDDFKNLLSEMKIVCQDPNHNTRQPVINIRPTYGIVYRENVAEVSKIASMCSDHCLCLIKRATLHDPEGVIAGKPEEGIAGNPEDKKRYLAKDAFLANFDDENPPGLYESTALQTLLNDADTHLISCVNLQRYATKWSGATCIDTVNLKGVMPDALKDCGECEGWKSLNNEQQEVPSTWGLPVQWIFSRNVKGRYLAIIKEKCVWTSRITLKLEGQELTVRPAEFYGYDNDACAFHFCEGVSFWNWLTGNGLDCPSV